MTKKNKIFKGLPSVPKAVMHELKRAGFINKYGLPHSWAYMSRFLQQELITEKETKCLIILEMERDDGAIPRADLIHRFVRYLSRAEKDNTWADICKELNIEQDHE